MNPIISVIVPVFNTGEILRDTLDSILKQTFANFELILVDDGSTDESKEICEEYKKRDSRIIVIHQLNTGICSARNAGVRISSGQFLTFCDHDDLYDPNILKREYEIATDTGADIVNVGYKTIYEDKNEEIVSTLNITCSNREEIRKHFFEITYDSMSTVWVKLYKSSKLKNYLIFNTNYKKGHEDVNLNLSLLFHIDSFVSIDEILYTHIVRKQLSTSAKFSSEAIPAMIDEIRNYCFAINDYKVDINNNGYEYMAKMSAMLRSISVYAIKCDIDRTGFIKILSSLKCYKCHISLYDLLINKRIPIKDRIVLYALDRNLLSLLYSILRVYLFCSKHLTDI